MRSPVEGLAVAAPSLRPAAVPLALAILRGLFVLQRKVTSRVGAVFGPVILCCFAAMGALGLRQIALHPAALAALDPLRGLEFLRACGLSGALPMLDGVLLAVTGGEALYADMEHFGRAPIRLGWFAAVNLSRLLSYLGQGAFLLGDAPRLDRSTILMAPRPLRSPSDNTPPPSCRSRGIASARCRRARSSSRCRARRRRSCTEAARR